MGIEDSLNGNIGRDGTIYNVNNVEREVSPGVQLTNLYESTKQGNVLPEGFSFEDGAKMYYKAHNVFVIKNTLDMIRELASKNNLTNLIGHDDQIGISVEEAIETIQKNVKFSERVNQELNDSPPKIVENDPNTFNERQQKLRDKLRGKQ
ncbi:MAG: hypothetical protein KA052_01965 [Candidatus Pacebacteria bacterium]|nr:hypothetical protein [Candidatus Paceibacterota bacterium]